MSDTLTFSLVSPERELFSGQVDQVDLPGTEGNLGILPDHAPLMAAIRTGAITVYADGKEEQFFVQGGFADVTPAGLTVLAERATPMADVNRDDLQSEIDRARANLETLEDEGALAAQQNIDGLEALFNMV
ncbi:ATP synthase epsilon chain [Algimonas ampicilliniresistens]|uniref:ATP synthase epsilon chain n=1 Tax=Algimonas ampicilliniresistens TaxID=1298735 RepID=A0ABQ5V832_9PROT|nr:F0F1 ATP synthase subunit epsilon [Algimonas ampicilliniresistens]GLQ23139.1 ATP synthase epsilon chain [Algimonas ampicilliniresistens]